MVSPTLWKSQKIGEKKRPNQVNNPNDVSQARFELSRDEPPMCMTMGAHVIACIILNKYIYIYIYIFLAPDNESQGLFNPIAMTVQKLVKLHRRERLVERGEKREVEGGFEVWNVGP